MKKSTKIAIVSLLILLVCGASFGFYLYKSQRDEVKNQTAFFTAFNTCARHMPQDKNYQMYLDPENIPCYQKALQVGPDKSFEFMLASLLVKQGRYNEARPLLIDVAHSGPFGLLLRQQRTAEAKRLLQPGAMKKERANMMRSDQAQHDLIIITANNEKEEQEFLKIHAVMNGMQIVHMSAADKIVWLRMREQHDQEQRSLGKI